MGAGGLPTLKSDKKGKGRKQEVPGSDTSDGDSQRDFQHKVTKMVHGGVRALSRYYATTGTPLNGATGFSSGRRTSTKTPSS